MLGWLADFFANLFDSLIEFLLSILDWILVFIGWVLTALFSLLKDVFYWAYDGIIYSINYFLDHYDFDLGVYSPQRYIDQIPIEILQALAYIGFDTAFGIIISAYIIRITLRIIPFVGSVFK